MRGDRVLMLMLTKGYLPGLTAAHAHALAGSCCLYDMGERAVGQVLCTEEVERRRRIGP